MKAVIPFILVKYALLIGTNMVIYGLYNKDIEKPQQMFYEGNNFPVVTLNDLIDV